MAAKKKEAASQAGKLFGKILVANRGEIAVRVMRTAKRLGIKTVAVYSDADAEALHVREADEAVRIGPAPTSESYLKIDAILAACKATGAEAVHPGYGFLSENAAFATALEKAGIVFIGPTMKAVAAMGDKIESKILAQKAGVSTVPGYLKPIKDAEECVVVSRKIGYPVMIKASAGGGGKGMRIAWNDAEAREGFLSATSEAKSSFGDDRVFAEKFVEEPRHIEIQLIGDAHGNILYLNERECSIQRRHQKVIEEAPSPFLDPKTRAAMGQQAVALAKAVGYRSAGTVEFIVDKHKKFYFLEMNTRLQVEHPVTEMITGLDIVEMMIRVAAGEKLALAQKDVPIKGWAIEARIYAEDPLRNFMPSIGRLTRLAAPEGRPGIRVDTGVYEGAEISMYYDPMIAKLVAHGKTRAQATARIAAALDAYVVRGVNHNIRGILVGVAATIHHRQRLREIGISGQLQGHEAKIGEEAVVRLDGQEIAVSIRFEAGVCRVASAAGTTEIATAWQPGATLFEGLVDGAPVCVQVDRAGAGWRLFHAGCMADALVLSPRAAELNRLMPAKRIADTSRFLLSPMPGLLKSISVRQGQEIKAGEALCTVEAMKMENVLRAERDGTVAKIFAAAGDSLAVDQKIIEFG